MLPGGRGLVSPAPRKAMLTGPHAVSTWDFMARVDGRVTGVVVDVRRRPVAKETVYLHVAPGADAVAEHPFWLAQTGADGRYAFGGVPPGNYIATLGRTFEPAYARTAAGSEELRVGFAEQLELVPVVARVGTDVVVEGRVVDGDGQPVSTGFRVEVLGPRGPYPRSASEEDTLSDGRFRLRLLRDVRYRFTTTDETRSRRATIDVVADGSPIRLVRP